jgi:Transposase IS4/DDE_Tnp_1-like zinc-ribbon
VYLLSTHLPPNRFTSVRRKDKDGVESDVNLPTVIFDYNYGRGGVDLVDQLQGYYSIGRRSKKWWPRLAWWLIDLCIINSYSLYLHNTHTKISQLKFRLLLMQAILDTFPSPLACSERHSGHVQHNRRADHWPKHMSTSRQCVQCGGRGGLRRRTTYRCNHCRVYLCVDPCFRLYHAE